MNQENIQSTATTEKYQSPSSSSRARARWSILRSAILSNQTKNYGNNAVKDSARSSGSASSSSNTPLSLQHDSTTGDPDQTDMNASIHCFKGFGMLHRTIIPNPLEDGLIETSPNHHVFVEYRIPASSSSSSSSSSSFYTTTNTSTIPQETEKEEAYMMKLKTRERCHNHKIQIKDLMSHVHYGVDNTGNTRLWDSSSVLTYCIANSNTVQRHPPSLGLNLTKSLQSSLRNTPRSSSLGLESLLALATITTTTTTTTQPPTNVSLGQPESHKESMVSQRVLNVVELGAGMCALPSLFLASVSSRHDNVIVRAIVTDGHPHSVQNNNVCARLNHLSSSSSSLGLKTAAVEESQVSSHKLLWKGNEEGAEECKALRQKYLLPYSGCKTITDDQHFFDLCIVSDCTHFKDFHSDLAITIARLLRVGGKCICMQPSRGRTLEQFIELLRDMNRAGGEPCGEHDLFEISFYDNYNHFVTQKHCELMEEDTCHKAYNPSIHYPLLLELKKKRKFVEHLDGKVALEHMKTRL